MAVLCGQVTADSYLKEALMPEDLLSSACGPQNMTSYCLLDSWLAHSAWCMQIKALRNAMQRDMSTLASMAQQQAARASDAEKRLVRSVSCGVQMLQRKERAKLLQSLFAAWRCEAAPPCSYSGPKPRVMWVKHRRQAISIPHHICAADPVRGAQRPATQNCFLLDAK